MAHTIHEKTKLLNRVRRIRGQVEALERALDDEKGCAQVLHLVAGVRGAITGLMAEVMEDHIRFHVVDPAQERDAEKAQGAIELIEAVHAYLK
jgi:FrmR/RcnR family transcriptional regulator, repressor of frmRAB operon